MSFMTRTLVKDVFSGQINSLPGGVRAAFPTGQFVCLSPIVIVLKQAQTYNTGINARRSRSVNKYEKTPKSV